MSEKSSDIPSRSRRKFLREGGAAVGGLVAGAAISDQAYADDAKATDNLPPNIPEWMKTPGADVGSQPYGTPSRYEKGIIRNIPKNQKQYTSSASRTPLQDLDGIITPSGLFYERHHGGFRTSTRPSTGS